MTDVITGGRLELGIARGAYSFEYERIMPGLDAWNAGQRMRELIPAMKKLWEGDYAHQGEFWQFPKTTSAPKPIQQPHPPIWIAARDPNSHDFAVANGCNVQVTPLAQGDEEITSLIERFDAACAKHPATPRPKIMLLRHTYVGSDEADIQQAAREISVYYNYFGAWFKNESRDEAGPDERSPRRISMNPMFSPEVMRKNNVVGDAATVIDRLKAYESMGYDEYSFWIDTGMSFERKKPSLDGSSPTSCRHSRDAMPRFQQYIDGVFEDGGATSRASIPRPASLGRDARGRDGRCRSCGRAAAPRAFTSGPWPAMTATARGKLLIRLADLVAANARHSPRSRPATPARSSARPRPRSPMSPTTTATTPGSPTRSRAPICRSTSPTWRSGLRREPVGVVAAIVPWNSQLFLAAVKLGPALAAGCTVVVKASEDGPAPLLEFARLVHEAGFPPGVVNIITGFGDDLRRGAHPPPEGRPCRLHRRPRHRSPRRAELGREPRQHVAGARRQIPVHRVCRRRPRQRRQRPGRRHLRRRRAELRRRFAPRSSRQSVKHAVPGDLESEGRSRTDRTAARPGHGGRPAVHGSPARA